jgi:hypothetical protein
MYRVLLLYFVIPTLVGTARYLIFHFQSFLHWPTAIRYAHIYAFSVSISSMETIIGNNRNLQLLQQQKHISSIFVYLIFIATASAMYLHIMVSI